MNLTQLKYFNAICTHKTISAAAEKLYVSQPTISNAIKELEDEFGTILFTRHHKGMSLTTEGETLYNMSKELIARAGEIETIMHDAGNKKKTIRLGIPPMIGYMYLPKIFRDFIKKNPDIEIDITEGGKSELKKKLDDGYLDIIFLSHNEPPENSYLYEHIAKVEIVCCVSKSNPLASKKRISAQDLENENLVLFKNSFFQTETIKQYFLQSEITPKILLQTEQLSNVLNIISNNIAVGFLFKPPAKEKPELKAISLDKPIFADISLVWKKSSYVSDSMKKFIEWAVYKVSQQS